MHLQQTVESPDMRWLAAEAAVKAATAVAAAAAVKQLVMGIAVEDLFMPICADAPHI